MIVADVFIQMSHRSVFLSLILAHTRFCCCLFVVIFFWYSTDEATHMVSQRPVLKDCNHGKEKQTENISPVCVLGSSPHSSFLINTAI